MKCEIRQKDLNGNCKLKTTIPGSGNLNGRVCGKGRGWRTEAVAWGRVDRM